jgi:hypothetical protein
MVASSPDIATLPRCAQHGDRRSLQHCPRL